MSIDSTARESNIRDSVKKYFVDGLVTGKGIQVTFDKYLSTPKIQGLPAEVDKWVSIMFGEMVIDSLSYIYIDIVCCSKQDSEGFKLAQVRDSVMDLLVNSDGESTSMISIPLYRSRRDGAWTLIGHMGITNIRETGSDEAPDGVKFKVITIALRWGAKV